MSAPLASPDHPLPDAADADPELLRAKLNAETGKLAWAELQRPFARGVVVKVSATLDLVEVALAVSRDDAARVADWARAGQIARASDADARTWQAEQTVLWAVVAAPWVLVQDAATRPSEI